MQFQSQPVLFNLFLWVQFLCLPVHGRGWCSVLNKSSTSQSNRTCRYKTVFSGRVQKYFYIRKNFIPTSSDHFAADSNSLCATVHINRHLTHRCAATSVAEKRFDPSLAYRGRSGSFRFVIFLRENRLGSQGTESADLWLEYQFE
jgi:hypothetical protein